MKVTRVKVNGEEPMTQEEFLARLAKARKWYVNGKTSGDAKNLTRYKEFEKAASMVDWLESTFKE